MKLITSVAALRDAQREWPSEVGFVPTMGALHAGHLHLVERARRECAFVIASIFVNPTQFNDPKDLQNYPRDVERDLNLLNTAGVDAVFLPDAEEMYADHFRFKIQESEISRVLCGPKRPGHFDGVLTVVMKLFQLVRPVRAYFGEKDYQQLKLIKDMAQAFFLNTEIVAVPTVREADGLAMSSRNLLLSPSAREKAPRLFQILRHAPSAEAARAELTAQGFTVDYLEEHWGRRFVAAFLGGVRLIDNVEL